MPQRLENKVAVITGAGRGIGKETARKFILEGAKVGIIDLMTGEIEKVCNEVDNTGNQSICLQGDVTNRGSVKAAVETVAKRWGRIDILINNAGIVQDSLIQNMTDEQWDKVLTVDLKGAFICIQEVLKYMLPQGSGVILNASSVSGVYGNIGQVNYAAAKAGLIGMTRTLAKELGRKGIRVNAVAPGFITTPMTAKVPQKILDLMKDRTPLKMLGEPHDIASAYVYLASDEARYVNGCVLSVDGGLVI